MTTKTILSQIHQIECECKAKNQIYSFPVCSVLDIEKDEIIPHFVECPNCKKILKIVELCSAMPVQSLVKGQKVDSVESIQKELPKEVISFFENSGLDLSQWQKIKYIYDSKFWEEPDWSYRKVNHDNSVVISAEMKNGEKSTKRAFFNSPTQIYIKNIKTNEIISTQ